MSENERQSRTNAVVNDKLQGTVVTDLRCGGIFNKQIKKGLLLSPSVKTILKSVNIWHIVTGKVVDCVVLFLRRLALWWPVAQNARDNHLLACIRLFKKIHWQTQQ